MDTKLSEKFFEFFEEIKERVNLADVISSDRLKRFFVVHLSNEYFLNKGVIPFFTSIINHDIIEKLKLNYNSMSEFASKIQNSWLVKKKMLNLSKKKKVTIPFTEQLIEKFKETLTTLIKLGFNLNFILRISNFSSFKPLIEILINLSFSDKKVEIFDVSKIAVLKSLNSKLQNLDFNISTFDYIKTNMHNIEKFISNEIIPISVKISIKLIHDSYKVIHGIKIRENLNLISKQASDPLLNEEFYSFLSPFEDFILYKSMIKSDSENIFIFENFIRNKYTISNKVANIWDSFYGKDKIYQQDFTFKSLFENSKRIENILVKIIEFLDKCKFNLNKSNLKIFKVYAKIIQGIMYIYGSFIFKNETLLFKTDDSKDLNLKYLKIKEKKVVFLSYIQNYLVEIGVTKITTAGISFSYTQLGLKSYKEEYRDYITDILKFFLIF